MTRLDCRIIRFWAGSYEQLRINMENIEHKFHKPVIVMETAFPYTDASHDEMPNIVTGQLTMEKMGLPPSVENQKSRACACAL